MIDAPIVICVRPTTFEIILLDFIDAHFFQRSTPAMKSNNPMARSISVNTDMIVGSTKTLTSIMFSKIKKTIPVKIRLVTIRKPPMARLSLTSFRIYFTRLIARDASLSG